MTEKTSLRKYGPQWYLQKPNSGLWFVVCPKENTVNEIELKSLSYLRNTKSSVNYNGDIKRGNDPAMMQNKTGEVNRFKS